MNADRWKQIEDCYHAAMGRPVPERAAFLAQACADDPELRGEVQSLLDQQADPFLESAPLPAIKTLSPGAKLGNFEIVELIGRGGMGEVYRARDSRLKRDVAIKVLPAGLARNPDRIARFEREARAAGGLNHPNIVAVHDIGREDGTYWIATELVAGESLAKVIERGPLAVGKALEIGTQIADGLAAAHTADIVHRDLKPANIMVARDGRVKILDFGLALRRRVSQDSTTMDMTDEGTVRGTAGYMSPEQVRGEMVDQRSDLFSFGVILYEMLGGKRAFAGGSSVEVMHAILKEDPAGLPPSVPPALDRIVRRCLEKDRERRFQTAADLGFALGSMVVSQSAAAPARKHRAWAWAAVGAICLSAIGAAYWWRFRPGTSVWTDADASVRKLTNDSGLTTDGAISADGKLFAYASDRADSTNLDIWVEQVNGGGAVRVTDDPADDYDPAFSSDGLQVAFRSEREGGGIYVAPAIGGPAHLLVPQGRRPRFSPDGHSLLYWIGPRENTDIRGINSAKLFVQPLPEGTVTQIGAGCALFPESPVWSPKSDRILFMGTCGNTTGGWVSTLDGKVLKSNPSLQKLNASLGAIDQWAADPSRLLVILRRGASFVAAVPISADGTEVTGPVNRLTFGTGNETLASTAASGRMVFSATTVDQHIWSLAIDEDGKATGTPRQLTNGATGESSPALSRDGRRLAFNAGRLLYYKDLATGKEREIPSAGYWATSPVFSPDGAKIMFANYARVAQDIFSEVPATGGFSKKIWGEPGKYNGWLFDWSPDGSRLLFQDYAAAAPYREVVKELDLRRLRPTTFLDDPQFGFDQARLSSDGRWVAFTGIKDDGGASRLVGAIYVTRFREGLAPPSDWIRVTGGDEDGRPRLSCNDKLVFFVSERDGFRCIWGQHLGSDMQPVGSPFAVYHSHQRRRSLGNTSIGGLRVEAGPDMLVFNPTELTGNIWLLEPAKKDAR